jgi:hypothetical protein
MSTVNKDKQVNPQSAASHKQESCSNTHDGKVVSVVGDKLNTTCCEGKQHSHTVAKDTKVTCDNQPSKAADLKAGTQVRVTTRKDNPTVATAVESGRNIQEACHKA